MAAEGADQGQGEEFGAWEERQKAERRRAAQAELAEFNAQRQRELEARRQERAKQAEAASQKDATPASGTLGGYVSAPAVPEPFKALVQACGSSEEMMRMLSNPAVMAALQGKAPEAPSVAAAKQKVEVRVREAGDAAAAFRRVLLPVEGPVD
ncbi:unnamed protein product [Symbiodinium natans]|uniref:Uncharacterized protein n=1 Tax=Symbiodinium natans TaxID=878477 RepID=A0A812SZD5_9DINO|nr:unnamed protein product [Symbiodinium natans]